MGKDSKIEWTHHTFNPWIGCTKVSAGCKNCYAETLMDQRWKKVAWGTGKERKRTTAAYWRQPIKWDQEAAAAGERRRVFCASLADVFDLEVETAWRKDLFHLIEKTPNLDWLILTKRPEVARDFLNIWGTPPNVWLGVSVEDQKTADERIPLLLEASAAVRFVSYEPALGPVDFDKAVHGPIAGHLGYFKGGERKVDWVIVGGESGQKARIFDLDWARSTIAQCRAADVACFVKQMGAVPHDSRAREAPTYLDNKGGDPSEWPKELRVREFPKANHLDRV